jgi:hypothetical protein
MMEAVSSSETSVCIYYSLVDTGVTRLQQCTDPEDSRRSLLVACADDAQLCWNMCSSFLQIIALRRSSETFLVFLDQLDSPPWGQFYKNRKQVWYVECDVE